MTSGSPEPAAAKTRWYRQASALIALMALVFSPATTFYAERRSGERDEVAARVELSQLIQRLTALPRETAEIQAQYAQNPGLVALLGGTLETEKMVMVQQAGTVIRRIPDDVSATEYFAVAQAMLESGLLSGAEELIDAGLAREPDTPTRAALLRIRGGLHFATGEVTEGRRAFAEALDVYAGERAALAAGPMVFTEYLWAFQEKWAGECALAADHVAAARERLEGLAPSSYSVQLQLTVDSLADTPMGGCP